MIVRRLVITGRVQRVFYRDWTVATAQALGLDGWVRNRSDGSVEALFAGDEDKVAAMIEACRRGPPAAAVADVTVETAEPQEPSGFAKRPTV